MGKAVSKVVGGLLGGGSSPKVSSAATTQTEEAKRTANSARSALYETEGGAAGEELNPDDVEKRRNLLGN